MGGQSPEPQQQQTTGEDKWKNALRYAGNMGLGLLSGGLNAFTGGIIGNIFQGIGDQRQLQQQKELMALQEQGNMRMADYTQKLQYDMWEKTNYSAQVEQLKKAGLNPALLYGKGGGGGATTGGASAGSVSAGQAGNSTGAAMQAMGIMNQNNLMAAQAKKLEAETKNIEAQTQKTTTVDTEAVKVGIQKMIAETTNTEARTLLTKAQKAQTDLEIGYLDKTLNQRIELVDWAVDTAITNLKRARQEVFFSSETMDSEINRTKALGIAATLQNTLTGVNIENARKTGKNLEANYQNTLQQTENLKTSQQLTIAQIAKTNTDIGNSLQEMAAKWKTLDQNQKRLELDALTKKIELYYKGETNLGVTFQTHDRNATILEIDKIMNKN